VAVLTRAAYVPPSPRPLPEGTPETDACGALGRADERAVARVANEAVVVLVRDPRRPILVSHVTPKVD